MSTKQARITQDREKEICDLIVLLASRSKNGKVTWGKLEEVTGFTRQALSARDAIAEAYKEVNSTTKTKVTSEKRVEELEAKLTKIQAECSRLKKTLQEYDQKYVRWMYNATNANLTVEQLNSPVPHSMKTESRRRKLK
ncbi:hypothetical protein DEU29_13111 [Idiomarina aquatica]|uniref:Uncharacterized protein n=1 Tax=Idiomarina aquatica TaxID=1327752 RepID=A0A4R6NXU7_9GAMM|nr:hypothetical protein [Idiomarina aquatica]TDP27338.1 hypothetical protein DEU29_13111 [Idiomarina aquatica]